MQQNLESYVAPLPHKSSWVAKIKLALEVHMNNRGLAIVAVLVLAGCATTLEPNAEKLRTVTAEQKANCESLGLVTTDQQLGPYKASNSMNSALNEAARRGANAVYLVSQGRSGIDGASVTVEALRCK